VSATLLAIPNVSEGRDEATIGTLRAAFGPGLLDVHDDPDHHRSVYTIAGAPGRLASVVLNGAKVAVAEVDVVHHQGIHPRVGAIDVAPIVYLGDAARGAACAEALVLADEFASTLQLPVFLYGELAGGRTRAELRRGGLLGLARRMESGEHVPDFGPRRPHPTAGAVLVAARPPLVAFNVELAAPATLDDAKTIAALIREGGGEGLQSLRAIGLWLYHRNVAQVSMNVEDHRTTPLAAVVAAIARHARPARAELVGLAPAAAFEGFPSDLEVANKRLIEQALSPGDPEGH
jgi:glutamate formiminotransferase / 5-formyltetrahydrofolate cyclo-ligase